MSAALIEAARAALRALGLRRNLGNSAYDEQAEKAVADLRTALAAAEAQPAQIITAGYVKRLADKMAHAKAACDIPTGDLWRSITQDRYADARQELFDAIDALASGSAAEAQPVGEPVAWAWKHKGTAARGMYFEDPIKYFDTLESADSYELTPLYAAPQPAARPLTDEQIRALVLATVYEGDSSTAHRDAWAAEIGIPFARAIEAAHAIGSQP